ncbi:MAG TPA: aldo/keto reductase [Casimicrobiaceae bacterium]|nr:aldo/keto reductase [Casimicrobiaceae bacterium]
MPHSTRWPRIGLGCASLGSPALSDADAERVMNAAIERGIRFFDVAPLYGGGLAEERLGRALRALRRDDYMLCTKTGVTRPYAQPPMPPGATRRRQFDRWDYGAGATRASIGTSLQRLQVGRLDVVHLHDVEDHLDRCLEAYGELARLRDQGLVGAIGIGSNLVEPVEHLLAQADFRAFLLAGCYTLLEQSATALIRRAHERGIAVVAGGVFNSGVLAAWPQPEAATYGYAPATPDVLARTAEIAAICERHRVPIAVAALQFVLANPSITTVLIGPRSVDELHANLDALRDPLPDALWSSLEDANLIPRGSPRPLAGRDVAIA